VDRAERSSRGGLKISEVSTRVYDVPTDQPEADGTLEWSSTTVVAVEVRAENVVGLGWTYASSSCKALIDETLAPLVLGSDPLSITGTHEEMVRRCRNFGRPGIVACAISAIDIALWDLKARLFDCSLSDLFGRCRETVPVYGSGGFTTYDDATATAQLERWVGTLGVRQVKIKIGESWGTNVARDLARVAHARSVIGEGIELFVDANGGYSRKQAVRVGIECSDVFAVSWFEEPVSSDDLDGLREVRDQTRCDVAAGEYGYDEAYFARLVRAKAVDCVQVDVTRCGGYTSWLRVAAIAAANGLDVSAHCAPSLHAPVAAAVPNLRHVEYFHDHERVDALLFEGARVPHGGAMDLPAGDVGHGMAERQSEKFRVA
jgi:L-alanine-DL-glutamate epimerase-like enolase superfamily enzyme